MLLIHVNDADAKFNRAPDTFVFGTQIFRAWVATIPALPSACSPQKLQDSPARSESPPLLTNFCQVRVRSCCFQSRHPCCMALKLLHDSIISLLVFSAVFLAELILKSWVSN